MILVEKGSQHQHFEVADLANVPTELEQWERPTHLAERIPDLWNGDLPIDDEDDDPDYSPEPDCHEISVIRLSYPFWHGSSDDHLHTTGSRSCNSRALVSSVSKRHN